MKPRKVEPFAAVRPNVELRPGAAALSARDGRFAARLGRQTLILGVVWTCVACAAQPSGPGAPLPAEAPRRVILIIADGAGAAHWSLLPVVLGSRTLDAFPVTGLVVPRGTSPRVIDSAASATAYAIGMPTFNGAIGVGPDSTAHETVLEAAADAGIATGLVTTTSITDATPASFAAHVPDPRHARRHRPQVSWSAVITISVCGCRSRK